MSGDFLRRQLFRPFQTTKKHGDRYRDVSDQGHRRSARRDHPGRERTGPWLDFSRLIAYYFSRRMKQKLLIIDDDEAIRSQMKWALNGDLRSRARGGSRQWR